MQTVLTLDLVSVSCATLVGWGLHHPDATVGPIVRISLL